MPNIYLARPDALDLETCVTKTRPLAEGLTGVVLAENPFRSAGGGQPADRGTLALDRRVIRVVDVRKDDGETWILLPGPVDPGAKVRAMVDARRRHLLSQAHSLTHLLMAGFKESVPGYESKGADISEAGLLELRFLSVLPLTEETMRQVDRRTRSRIAVSLPIRAERARSIEKAAETYPTWRVDPGLGLSGKIRVIVIEGLDANPCSGSHVSSTAEIGPYEMLGVERRGELNVVSARKLAAWSCWY